jgi:hypothetical protein
MRHIQFLWLFVVLVLFQQTSIAGGVLFTPTEAQTALLREGIENVKILKETYSHLTMTGTTEYFDSRKPKDRQQFTGSFNYARLGDVYCLIELQVPNPDSGNSKPEMLHVCRVINPNASYRFVGQGMPPVFVLDEKNKTTDVSREIASAVDMNWKVGASPYCSGDHSDFSLSMPFTIQDAKAASPVRGGYIKDIREETIEGERVVSLEMGFYFKEQEACGISSFYRDHFWVLKESSSDSVNSKTGEIISTIRHRNTYDFSGEFPKLRKTSIETVSGNGTVLDAQISTITGLDFTKPDVAVFDAKRFIHGAENEEFIPEKRRFSIFQIIGFAVGIVLIIWGILLRVWQKK